MAPMKSPDTVGVFVVDDHVPFIDAARAVVGATPGFELIGFATSASSAQMRLAEDRAMIDLVLMDVELGDGNGVELTQALTSEPAHPVVFLISMIDAEDLGSLPSDCGAAGFISKLDLSPSELEHRWAARTSSHTT